MVQEDQSAKTTYGFGRNHVEITLETSSYQQGNPVNIFNSTGVLRRAKKRGKPQEEGMLGRRKKEQLSPKNLTVLWPEEIREERQLTRYYCSINCSSKARRDSLELDCEVWYLTHSWSPQRPVIAPHLTSTVCIYLQCIYIRNSGNRNSAAPITLTITRFPRCQSPVVHSHCPLPQRSNYSYSNYHEVYLLP